MCQRGRRVVQTKFQETQHRRKNIGCRWRKRWIISEIPQNQVGRDNPCPVIDVEMDSGKKWKKRSSFIPRKAFLPAAHASNLYVFYILRPSPSDIMNISFDKMKAFTMHSLRFYLLDWASSSVWDAGTVKWDLLTLYLSWQLCTSAVALCWLRWSSRIRWLSVAGGLVEVVVQKQSLLMCLTSCLESLRFALTYGNPSLDQAERCF